MELRMEISHIKTVTGMSQMLESGKLAECRLVNISKKEVYDYLRETLIAVKYKCLRRGDKSIVKRYLLSVTGYSEKQFKRLIKRYKDGKLYWIHNPRPSPKQRYTKSDIRLLHEVDSIHRLSGPATRRILQREFLLFENQEYERLAGISSAHIYNLRNSRTYVRQGRIFEKTKPTVSNIGIRMKPKPDGKPGHLRVDTVHQGDKDGVKGLYYINVVDEVTQFEFVFCVEAISERFLLPKLRQLIEICPFLIMNFHSDNGSEYINYRVAELLNKLHIKQTKSRPRKSNDNGLVEGKNAAIIRKEFGHAHLPATKHNADLINQFCLDWLNVYINYHRPCAFPTNTIKANGKIKKTYKHQDYQTPYQKLKTTSQSQSNLHHFLKPGITFEALDSIAYAFSDTTFARSMAQAKISMFKSLKL